MEFTDQEIMFLTSVSRGRMPFGVNCQMPDPAKKQDYIEETIESLAKKGILNTERKLTREGAEIIYFWEQYRNSKRHIRLNHVNAAVLPGNILITVIKKEKGYDVSCINSAVFMMELLKHADYLCLGEEKEERGKWQVIDGEAWKKELADMEGCILLYEYRSGRLKEEKVYYWKNGEGYLYYKTQGRMRTLSPGVMRKQIYRILEEESEDGR